MMIINYLLLMALVTALLVAVYAALIRWLHTPVRANPDEGPSQAARINRPAIARNDRERGVVSGRLIGMAMLHLVHQGELIRAPTWKA